tara:strand:- start:8349 stop:9242 length:894 start_codon:yes stop_codon:yes gene_type:complete
LEKDKTEVQLNYYRSKLLPYAYNIVGDSMEAEDVVQEILNKYLIRPVEGVMNIEAYLVKAVINRSINQKKLLRNRKEQYLGEWLPTPVFTENGIYSQADQKPIIEYSLMVLLERLNPTERAVFILKEAFNYTHREIAETLELQTDHCRQLLKRAKQKLQSKLRSEKKLDETEQKLLRDLSTAILSADLSKIEEILSAEVVCLSDGGNKVSAARNRIVGKVRVLKLLKAIYGKYLLPSTQIVYTTVNYKPAILYLLEKHIYRCIVFEIEGSQIKRFYVLVNPDKLQRLNTDYRKSIDR